MDLKAIIRLVENKLNKKLKKIKYNKMKLLN